MSIRKSISYSLFILLIILVTPSVYAQEKLSMLDAVDQALKNNYGIRIAQLDKEVAYQNNTWGNAGAMPSLALNATGAGFTTDNQASFLRSRLTGTISTNLSWTLFDGLAMFANKQQLNLLENISAGNAAVIIENTVQGIMLAYNNILVAAEQEKTLLQSLSISKDRLAYQEFRKDLGATGTFELLQFKDAVLTDSANLLTQRININNAYRNLNLLMGVDIQNIYTLTDTLDEEFDTYAYRSLRKKMLSNNQSLQNQYLTNELRRQELKSFKAQQLPSLNLNASSSYITGRFGLSNGETRNTTGVLEYSANLTLSFNLYNGDETRRQIEVSKINNFIADLQEKDLKLSLENDLLTAHETYEQLLLTLAIRREAVENADSNLDIATERFQAGLINSLDFRDIQAQFLTANFNKYQTIRDLKEIETELLRLTGGFIQQPEEE
ncbi:MAG: TolC family protein [Bacteroidota bacterium]